LPVIAAQRTVHVVIGTKVRLASSELADPVQAIRRSLEASLRRLGRDVVDLVQLHNPITLLPAAAGDALPLEQVDEAAAALQETVRDGLARHVGATGLGDTAALREMIRLELFETLQSYFNALNPSAGYAGHSGGGQDFEGLIDLAARAGLGVIAIRVLAAGALSTQPERHPNAGAPGTPLAAGADYAQDLQRAQALASLAAELGLESPLELALRFALAKPGVSTVLVGFSSLAQLGSAIRWAERGPLPEEAVQRVVAHAA